MSDDDSVAVIGMAGPFTGVRPGGHDHRLGANSPDIRGQSHQNSDLDRQSTTGSRNSMWFVAFSGDQPAGLWVLKTPKPREEPA